MSWYPAYLDGKPEVVYNHGKIRGDYNGVSGTVALPQDILNLLWGASLFYMMENLSYRGIIHYTPGGIQETRIGNVQTQFMRQQPMFFMGRGNPGNLGPVMPFRSYKQIAEGLLDSYIEVYHGDSGSRWQDYSYQAWDRTSRGFGAIGDLDVIDAYDAELTGVTNAQ